MGEITKLARKFRFAIRGLISATRRESSLRIHGIVALVVVGAGWFFEVGRYEWILLFLCIGIVVVAELINTVIEIIARAVVKTHNHEIEKLLNISSGAVLVASIVAVIVGGLIFYPYLGKLFS